jgi:hypothetical protein
MLREGLVRVTLPDGAVRDGFGNYNHINFTEFVYVKVVHTLSNFFGRPITSPPHPLLPVYVRSKWGDLSSSQLRRHQTGGHHNHDYAVLCTVFNDAPL